MVFVFRRYRVSLIRCFRSRAGLETMKDTILELCSNADKSGSVSQLIPGVDYITLILRSKTRYIANVAAIQALLERLVSCLNVYEGGCVDICFRNEVISSDCEQNSSMRFRLIVLQDMGSLPVCQQLDLVSKSKVGPFKLFLRSMCHIALFEGAYSCARRGAGIRIFPTPRVRSSRARPWCCRL